MGQTPRCGASAPTGRPRCLLREFRIRRVWGSEWGASTGNLKALVARLRAKIEPDPDSPRLVENERGLGYRFVRPAPNARAAAEHASRAREASSG